MAGGGAGWERDERCRDVGRAEAGLSVLTTIVTTRYMVRQADRLSRNIDAVGGCLTVR